MSVPLINFEVCQVQAIGPSTATSQSVIFTTAGSTNTKSSYAQITASTTTDIGWIFLTLRQSTQTDTFNSMCIDIAIGGAGSEIDVIQNLVLSWPNTLPGNGAITLPLTIPAGTRLSYRYQTNVVGSSFELAIYGFTSNFQYVSSYESMGFDASNSRGTAVAAPAASNTKGAYTQLSSSTPKDYVGLFLAVDTNGVNNQKSYMFDLAIGAAASEIDIISSFTIQPSQGMTGCWFGFVPMVIPASSRLSVRNQMTSFVNAFERLNVTAYGAVG